MACARAVSNRMRIQLAPRTTEKPDILSRTPLSDGCLPTGRTTQFSGKSASLPNAPLFNSACVYCPSRASQITRNIFLGSEDDAISASSLLDMKIHYILNVAMESEPSYEVHKLATFVDPSRQMELLSRWNEALDEDMMDGPMERTSTLSPLSSSRRSGELLFPRPTKDSPFVYLHLRLTDSVDADIKRFFRLTNLFLRQAVESNSCVLVHCRAGISRSAAFVLAYLIENGPDATFPCPMSYDAAFDHVQQVREMINPNIGFTQQLTSFAHERGTDELTSCLSSPQTSHGFPGT